MGIPIKLVKLVKDCNELFSDLHDLTYAPFKLVRKANNDIQLSDEQKSVVKKYDIDKTIDDINLLCTTDEKYNYFMENIEKQDRRIILTEIIRRGSYDKNSIKSIYPLEVFAYLPLCPKCNSFQGVHYSKYQNYSEDLSCICVSCGHTKRRYACGCDGCSQAWNKGKKMLLGFKPYFNDGFILSHQDGDTGEIFDMEDQQDIETFINLMIKDEVFLFNEFLYARSTKNSLL